MGKKNLIKILFLLGTRPEIIKLAPLIIQFKKYNNYDVIVCSTGQHKEMLYPLLSFFKIRLNYDLKIMDSAKNLINLSSQLITKLNRIILKEKPDLIFVQGDTISAFIGAYVGFLNKVPIAHIEAGLRSFKKYSPFPEEVNRKLISIVSSYHFCPTKNSKDNLLKEGIKKNVFKVGNTVIDALFLSLKYLKPLEKQFTNNYSQIDFTEKIVLITGHRRESFGKPFESICNAIRRVALEFTKIQFVYPVHLNPNVQDPVLRILGHINNIFLLPPLDYLTFVWFMNKSYFIVTDSGGVQEEAPSLGKPVLVIRDVTERNEGILIGNAKLIGTQETKIYDNIKRLLTINNIYKSMSRTKNPYGDGKSSDRILQKIQKLLQ
jgi:UDP-N-acetylglucosamine 2-epimerase (non-hydrolysing)